MDYLNERYGDCDYDDSDDEDNLGPDGEEVEEAAPGK